MLDLSEQFSPFLVIGVFYNHNQVICVEAIHFALQFDFDNGPTGKARRVPATQHKSKKGCLDMCFKMPPAATC